LQPTDGDNEWLLRGVCYGAGKWVAVGGNGSKGLTLISQDGVSWTILNSQSTNDDCAFGNGVFTTGRRFSPDGMTWQDAARPPPAVRQMVFAEGRFVAVGDESGGNVSYSADGSTWTDLPITYVPTSGDPGGHGYSYVTYARGHIYAMKSCCGRSDYRFLDWDTKSDTSFTETPLANIVGTDVADGIASVNGHVLIYGPGFYFELPEGSATWLKHLTPLVPRSDGTRSDRPLLPVGYANGVYASPNAWSPDLINFNMPAYTTMLWANNYVPGFSRLAVRP
jgi:hypothetical protein